MRSVAHQLGLKLEKEDRDHLELRLKEHEQEYQRYQREQQTLDEQYRTLVTLKEK